MASPSKSPKPEAPPEDVPNFDNDPDVDMINEDGEEETGEGNNDDTTRPNGASMNLDGAPDADNGAGDDREARIANLQAAIENAANMPMRKDISLREFLSKMDDYAPIIPDAVTAHALTLAGLPPPPLGASKGDPQDANSTPLHLSRLLALATQKFIADIAADAYQYSRMRSGNLTSNTLSAVSNPGAASMGVALQSDAAGGAGAGGGSKPGDKSKQAGQHLLGLQRPGYGGGGQGGAAGRTVMTMEDLGASAANFGVNIKRSEFYR